MIMEKEKVVYKELSYKIVGVLFEVYNELGYGYKEIYYEKAVAIYFDRQKINYERQPMYRIKLMGEDLGKKYLDFLVDNKIILELKKGNYFSRSNIEQVKEYLKVTNKKLAILANFTSNGVKFMRILNINGQTG